MALPSSLRLGFLIIKPCTSTHALDPGAWKPKGLSAFFSPDPLVLVLREGCDVLGQLEAGTPLPLQGPTLPGVHCISALPSPLVVSGL